MLHRGERQRREQRNAPDEGHSRCERTAAFVDAAEERPERDRSDRQDRAAHHERSLDPERRDEDRRDDASEGRSDGSDRLDQAQDGDPAGVRRGPLDQGEPGDVDERVADAHDNHGRDGDGRDDQEAHQRDRQTPGGQEQGEWRREPGPTAQRDRSDRPEHAAQSDRRGEDAHALVAHPEEVERGHDHQHGEETADERLQAEPDQDEAGPGEAADGTHPRRQLVHDGGHRPVATPDGRGVYPPDSDRREAVDDQHRDVRDDGSAHGQQEPGDGRSDEGADPFGGTRRDVRGDELGRGPGKAWQQGHVERASEGPGGGIDGHREVERPDGRVEHRHGDGQDHGHDPQEMRREQDPLGWPARHRHPRERRQDSRGQVGGESQQSDRDRSADREGEDQVHDEERALAGPHREPPEHQVAQVRIDQCQPQRVERWTQARAEAAHRGRIAGRRGVESPGRCLDHASPRRGAIGRRLCCPDATDGR